jgi:hypothetical protein
MQNFPNLLLPAAFYGIARAREMGVPALARRAAARGADRPGRLRAASRMN